MSPQQKIVRTADPPFWAKPVVWCPFCPRPNGRKATTFVRILSLTLVQNFRGPANLRSRFLLSLDLRRRSVRAGAND